MGMPADIGIIDTMVGFPSPDRSQVYKFIQPHLRDEESKSFSMPAAYMFKDVPPEIINAAIMDSGSLSRRCAGMLRTSA